jgi:hypothetical protein
VKNLPLSNERVLRILYLGSAVRLLRRTAWLRPSAQMSLPDSYPAGGGAVRIFTFDIKMREYVDCTAVAPTSGISLCRALTMSLLSSISEGLIKNYARDVLSGVF